MPKRPRRPPSRSRPTPAGRSARYELIPRPGEAWTVPAPEGGREADPEPDLVEERAALAEVACPVEAWRTCAADAR